MATGKPRVLIIEPHSDDAAIGIGGFLEKFKDEYEYHFLLITASDVHLHHAGIITRKQRIDEYKAYVAHFEGHYVEESILPLDMDSRLDTFPFKDLVSAIEKAINQVKPDIIMAQGPSFHQDHRLTYEAVVAATRPTSRHIPHKIYLIENPTYVHSLGAHTDFIPNLYVELNEELLQKKLDNFKNYFPSQIRANDNYLSLEGIKNWARYRGIESRCGYAEGLKIFRQII